MTSFPHAELAAEGEQDTGVLTCGMTSCMTWDRRQDRIKELGKDGKIISSRYTRYWVHANLSCETMYTKDEDEDEEDEEEEEDQEEEVEEP